MQINTASQEFYVEALRTFPAQVFFGTVECTAKGLTPRKKLDLREEMHDYFDKASKKGVIPFSEGIFTYTKGIWKREIDSSEPEDMDPNLRARIVDAHIRGGKIADVIWNFGRSGDARAGFPDWRARFLDTVTDAYFLNQCTFELYPGGRFSFYSRNTAVSDPHIELEVPVAATREWFQDLEKKYKK